MKRLPALLATLPAGSGVSAKSRLALYCASGSARLIGVLVRQVPLDGSKQDQKPEGEAGGHHHHGAISPAARNPAPSRTPGLSGGPPNVHPPAPAAAPASRE